MKKFQPTLEHAFYALALAIAVLLRFVNLGALPLSDFEANWALQAMQVAQGLKPAIGPNPATVHLTAILFYIFGATNFLARFWPALAGCALVLAPWLLRGRLDRIAALVLAFGLAIDPGLVSMSHLAGGPMLAVTFAALTALLWLDGRRALAGLCAGVALLAGPSIWFGLVGVALAWAIYSLFVKKKSAPEKKKSAQGEGSASPLHLRAGELRTPLLWGLGTLLILGSLLFLSLKGLAAFFTAAGAFLSGWVLLTGVPIWQPLAALPAYELLPLAFAIAGMARGLRKKDATSIVLMIWALAALVLALIYPAKQVSDLTWALLPLWMLAALELSHHFDFAEHNPWEVAGTITLVVAFSIFGWLNLASLTNMDLSGSLAHTRMGLLGGVVCLIILSLLLVGTGWSASVARLGGVWGAVILLTLFTIALSTGTAGLRQPLTVELWQPEPRTGRVDLISKVAGEVSDLNRGYSAQLPLTVLSVDSAALRWEFRDWQVEQVNELAAQSTPELIITPQGNINLSMEYRGEALVLREMPDWSHATAAGWLKWFVYRQMPVQREDVILWVRSDLMLDSQDASSAAP